MKVTREYPEYKFRKITIELETEKDVLNLYRLTGDGMYYFFKEKYGSDIVREDGGIIDFKANLHEELEDSIPVDLRDKG